MNESLTVDDFFKENGILSSRWDHFESRPEQAVMAQGVMKSLSEGKHLIAEAGTGVGKTLAYLVPGVLWAKATGKRLLISTKTKALQEQLTQKDLPAFRDIMQMLGQDFRFEILMGSGNFLCRRRFQNALMTPRDFFRDKKSQSELHYLEQWLNQDHGQWNGLRDSLPFGVSESL